MKSLGFISHLCKGYFFKIWSRGLLATEDPGVAGSSFHDEVLDDGCEKISVIRSRTMGADIAFIFAVSGFQVGLVDIQKEIIDEALERIEENKGLFLQNGLIHTDQANRMSDRIQGTIRLNEGIMNSSYVTDAVSERIEVKTGVFKELDRSFPPGIVLASSTSAIDIDQIAPATEYSERVIGTHWTNPAHMLPS